MMVSSDFVSLRGSFLSGGVLAHGAAVGVLTGGMIAFHSAHHPFLSYCVQVFISLLILAFALKASAEKKIRYKHRIGMGLVCSMGGEFFLALPSDLFLAGLVCFWLAHVCYLSAFLTDSRPVQHRLPFLLAAGYGSVLISILWSGVPASLRLPVVLYAAVLLSMAAQAASRALAVRTPAAWAASVGGCLFVLSDTALAIGRFRNSFSAGYAVIMVTYFAAQWGIALSCREVRSLDNSGENRSNSLSAGI